MSTTPPTSCHENGSGAPREAVAALRSRRPRARGIAQSLSFIAGLIGEQVPGGLLHRGIPAVHRVERLEPELGHSVLRFSRPAAARPGARG